MKKTIAPSELILNPNGSVYHLDLLPEQIAQTIILVGDQGRVPRVSKYFDRIEHQVQKREFVTHTGWIGEKRLSVISTGIGTDNIDIVLNELDALVNIDLETRTIKDELTQLDLIRIGTSGSLNRSVGVDTHLISAFGIGLESLRHFYTGEYSELGRKLTKQFTEFSDNQGLKLQPYAAEGSQFLLEKLGDDMHAGITFSCPGFYGPQGRELRLGSIFGKDFFEACADFTFENYALTNFEMETGGIYAMAHLLGHRAVSCNAIIANRLTEEFSKAPKEVVEKLIVKVLERI